MRIALNAMQVRAAKSGVGQYINTLIDSMLRADHFSQFTLYCSPDNAGSYDFGARNFKTIEWGLPEAGKTARLLYEYAFLPRELQSGGFDIFHGMSNFLPRKRVCPFIVTIHDLSYYVHPERCPWLRRQYWYAMTRRTMANANLIITDSENSRRDIETFFPGCAAKTRVVPLAAHPRFQPALHGRHKSAVTARGITKPYVLFVGTLEPGKNVVRLIRAFDAIADDFPDHMLVIVGGRGWMCEPVYRAARHARARERIMMTGHLHDNELPDFYSFCEVFAFPSLYEGFGMPPLEAMACGAPVVTSKTSSLPGVVGDAAVMIDPESERDLAAALRRVLRDAALRDDLRHRGIKRAAMFSWDATAAETLKLYKQISG